MPATTPNPGPYDLDPFQSDVRTLVWRGGPAPATYFAEVLAVTQSNSALSTSPCGIQFSPGADDWVAQIDLRRFDAQPITNAEYINDIRGRTLTGDQSSLSIQIGGADINLFCNQGSDVVYVPGYSVAWQGLDIVSSFRLEVLVYRGQGGGAAPGWIVGENCTIT